MLKNLRLLSAVGLAICIAFGASAQTVTFSEPQKLVPSPMLPAGITTLKSNNNLDATSFHNRYYVAFRTAGNHFPGKKAGLYIMSSVDMKDWKLEHYVHTGRDLREPRFMVLNDKLFLYYFEGSKRFYKFEPKDLWVCSFDTTAQCWEEKTLDNMEGYVPWRIRTRNGKAYLSAYYGVDLYSPGKHEGDLRLFTSKDGYSWQPISEQAQVSVPGAEEGEFDFDPEGNMWACVRLEGEGALVAYADKDSLDNWKTFRTKKKYDSSLMFMRKGDMYLIARRNLGGNSDKFPRWIPGALRRKLNMVSYSLHSNRTALYKLDKNTKTFEPLIDLPGSGDTAFPALVKKDDNTYYFFNYTSDLKQPDKLWISGQLAHTFIYMSELKFED